MPARVTVTIVVVVEEEEVESSSSSPLLPKLLSPALPSCSYLDWVGREFSAPWLWLWLWWWWWRWEVTTVRLVVVVVVVVLVLPAENSGDSSEREDEAAAVATSFPYFDAPEDDFGTTTALPAAADAIVFGAAVETVAVVAKGRSCGAGAGAATDEENGFFPLTEETKACSVGEFSVRNEGWAGMGHRRSDGPQRLPLLLPLTQKLLLSSPLLLVLAS